MSADNPPTVGWTPIAFGALDIRAVSGFAPGGEILVAPTRPGDILCLLEPAASLWRRLVDAQPLPADALSPDEAHLVGELARVGLATVETDHPAAMSAVPTPTLSSPMHELVYAIVHHVARERGVACVFVKGPALHHQGLRAREHSGDVDVWCLPSKADDLATALEDRGWHRSPDPWSGTSFPHSIAMLPRTWGCEVDVHRRMPGLTLDDVDAFEVVRRDTVPVTYAGVEVQVPSPPTHAVLAAVNAVRPGIGQGVPTPLVSSTATATLRAGGPLALERARTLGAVPALRTELRTVAPEQDWNDDGIPHDWAWRTQPTRGRAYAVALLSLPARERLTAARRVLWPSDDVALASARRANDSTTDPGRARRQRLMRGLREAAGGWLIGQRGGRS